MSGYLGIPEALAPPLPEHSINYTTAAPDSKVYASLDWQLSVIITIVPLDIEYKPR